MKRTYESMVLLDNREVKKGWQNLKTEVCGVFEKHGAEVKSARRWDERRLAFPVQRQLRGTYMLLYFESDTGALTGIRRDLEYAEPVLRHLTQTCESVPETAFDPEEAFDESAIRVEDTGTMREEAAKEEASSDKPEKSEKSEKPEKSEKSEASDKAAKGSKDPGGEDGSGPKAESGSDAEAGKDSGDAGQTPSEQEGDK